MKKVYVAVAADLIHPGHLDVIGKARELGEVVIGLLTDRAIASYKRAPLLSYNERKVVIDARRLELKTTHEAKRASFQAKLVEMKDRQKATILENLNSRYPNINERWTTHFGQVLDRLEEVLAKIATHGVDTAAASRAITSARVVVDNQSLQGYVITITDESNLRSAAQASHEQLKADLGIAREAVKSARVAVQAARALIKQAPVKSAASESAVDDIIQ